MSAPVNFVSRIRASLEQLGLQPAGVGLDELAATLEDYVAQTLDAAKKRAPVAAVEPPKAVPAPEPKKPKAPPKSRKRRVDPPPEIIQPTPAEARGTMTWRDYFAFAPDQTVTRAELLLAFRERPMGPVRELMYRLAKAEIPS